MKSKTTRKKGINGPWRWMIGLEFIGMILVGLVFGILLFNPDLLSALTNGSSLPTPMLASTPPIVQTPTPLFVSAPTSDQALIETVVATPALEFDLSESNQVLPEDVLQEVAYFGGGGGDWECPVDRGDEHYVISAPDQAEWLSDVRIISCGWRPEETISVTVTHAGAVYATDILQHHGGDLAEYFLPLSESMPLGDYVVVMEAPSGRAETTVNIYLPSEPRLYSVDDTKLVLYSFVPDETVRLFAYQADREVLLLKLSGWSQYQVDSSGKLVIHAPENAVYYVVGNGSGLVENGSFRHSGRENRPILIAPCGGLPSYLESSHTSKPNASVESAVDLRQEPALSSVVQSQVAPGTLVSLWQGPRCVDSTPWWLIRIANGQSGWMPEYQDGVYLLQRYPKETLSEIAKEIPAFDFNLAATQPPPQDIFEEVDFMGQRTQICDQPPYTLPTIFRGPVDGELFTQSTLISCGWQKLEVLKGTIQYPGGRTYTQYIQANAIDNYSAQLDFTPELEAPSGTYTFTLAGQRGILSASAELHPPDGPRLYTLDPFHIFLYHFAPGESVRLFCYAVSGAQPGKLIAWQDLTVDQSGNQPVEVETTNCTFVALGQSSGEVQQIREWHSTIKKTCGGLLSRLKHHSNARIAVVDGTDKPVYALPGTSQAVVITVSEGTLMKTLSGPQCADNSMWWPVDTGEGILGWMSEEQNGLYLLEPLP